ncbi:MAG: hypothetical protein MK010_03885 [Erythrobacter sp.]|nr:hypothetical protein [Erythrobacter sp.]
MSVDHAQRLTAGVGLFAAIVLLLAAAQHVAFGQAEQRVLTNQTELL